MDYCTAYCITQKLKYKRWSRFENFLCLEVNVRHTFFSRNDISMYKSIIYTYLRDPENRYRLTILWRATNDLPYFAIPNYHPQTIASWQIKVWACETWPIAKNNSNLKIATIEQIISATAFSMHTTFYTFLTLPLTCRCTLSRWPLQAAQNKCLSSATYRTHAHTSSCMFYTICCPICH